ncbi:MAG: DUF11 domain-containing protein [bacterium]|nr:DUF11 domain-containing protein [bacterium]
MEGRPEHLRDCLSQASISNTKLNLDTENTMRLRILLSLLLFSQSLQAQDARELFSPADEAVRLGAYQTSKGRAPGGTLIEIDFNLLHAAPSALSFTLPAGESYVIYKEGSPKQRESSTWWGKTRSGDLALFASRNGLLRGVIFSERGVYRIEPRSGYHFLVEVDSTRPFTCGVSNQPRDYTPKTHQPSCNDPDWYNVAEAPTVIDLLVLYTPEALGETDGVEDMELFIDTMILESNAIFQANNIAIEFNVAHARVTDSLVDGAHLLYQDSGDSETDKLWLSTDPLVAQLRDEHSADLVSLLVEDLEWQGLAIVCGRANVMEQSTTGPSFAANAFQVTRFACAADGLTFIHEHGHNMGLQHDFDPTSQTDPDSAYSSTREEASFCFSFGHFETGLLHTGFRTIMSTTNECDLLFSWCPLEPYFSNPDGADPDSGAALGVRDKADNRQTLELTAPIVANFRAHNDHFEKRYPLTELSGENAASSDYSSTEPTEPLAAELAGSIWWEYTAPETGALTITAEELEYVTKLPMPAPLAVYTGTQLSDLVEVASDLSPGQESQVSLPVDAGSTYFIQVGKLATLPYPPFAEFGTINLSWQLAVESDFFLTVEDNPDPVIVDSELSYTARIFNTLPVDVPAATLTAVLPDGVTLLAIDSSTGFCSESSGTITCNFDAINSGSVTTVSIHVRPSTAGLLTASFEITVPAEDPNPGNNTATLNTTAEIAVANVGVLLNDTGDPSQVGTEVAYYLTIINAGPAAATDVRATISLSAEVSFLAAIPTDLCSEDSGIVTCSLGSVQGGATTTVAVAATPNSVGTITTGATVTALEPDPNLTNNTALEETTIVETGADLEVVLVDLADPVIINDNLAWLVNITNHGLSHANDVVLTSTLPENVIYVGTNMPGACSESGGVFSCEIGALESRTSYPTIEIIAQAVAEGAGVNIVEVSGSEADPQLLNNTAQESTLVIDLGGLSEHELTADDAAPADLFGNSVSISGDTVVVGAPYDDDAGSKSGSAYVFVRSGTSWIEREKLTASDAAPGDEFGDSVAVSGDTILIGAARNDDACPANPDCNSGSAYVFVRSGTSWVEQQKLTASDAAAVDLFGESVAISGETAVVGSAWDDDAGGHSGSAYVFVRSGTSWTQQQKLTASDAAIGDEFGRAVAISGDDVVIGARLDDDAGTDSGSAYVFVRSGVSWAEQQKLTASDAEAEDLFGFSVAVSGETVLIGARESDGACPLDPNCDSGSAYVFVRSGTSWTQQQELTADDEAALNWYGGSVTLGEDIAVVGSDLADDAGNNSGAAYVFVRSGTSWVQQQELIATDGADGDRFGISVSNSGGPIVVGAFGHNHAGSDSGAAYVYALAAPVPTITVTAPATPITLHPGDTASLAWTSTDTDPLDDIVLAMKRDIVPPSETEPDGVNWFRFSTSTENDGVQDVEVPPGVAFADDWRFYARHEPSDAYDATDLSFSVVCPDEDSDGVCDHVDYCPGYDDTLDADGDGVPDDCDLCFGDNSNGDCDGDGTCDELDPDPCTDIAVELAELADPVALGAEITWLAGVRNNGPETANNVVLTDNLPSGVVFVSTSEPGSCTEAGGVVTCDLGTLLTGEEAASIAITAETLQAGIATNQASVVASEGDPETSNNVANVETYVFDSNGGFGDKLLPGDGTRQFGTSVAIAGDLVVVGVHESNTGPGAAYVFEKVDGSWIQRSKLVPPQPVAGDWFGYAVGIIDSTVFVGAPMKNLFGNQSGAAYRFERQGDVWLQEDIVIGSDVVAEDRFGWSISAGDGLVAFGAPYGNDNVADDSGKVYVYTFDQGILAERAKLTASDAADDDHFGSSVAVGDGIIAVGADDSDPQGDSSGSVYVFEGAGEVWTERSILVENLGGATRRFGTGLAVNGQTLVIGTGGANDFGSAYIFERFGDVWLETQNLAIGDPAFGDLFGAAAAFKGQLLAVSSFYDDDNGDNSGSVYLFRNFDGEWLQTLKIIAFDGSENDNFGAALAINDSETLVVGSIGDDDAGLEGGAAYVYDLGTVMQMTLPSSLAEIEHGESIELGWTGTNTLPFDSMVLSMKRDAVPPSHLEPDGVDWFRFTEDTVNDESEVVTVPQEVAQEDDWRFYVRHRATGAFDATDFTFSVRCADADDDSVCDGDDLCPGFDDLLDDDGDGTPDGCDLCAGFDDNEDTDADGVPDGCDACIGCGLCSATSGSATIRSTGAGGLWHSPSTWLQDRVPDPTDRVQINGPVSIRGDAEIASLSVDGIGALDGGNGFSAPTLIVSGDLVNQGTIGKPNTNNLHLVILGDTVNHGQFANRASINVHGCISNHGTWDISTTLGGSGPRTIGGSVALDVGVTIGGDVELANSIALLSLGISYSATLTIKAPVIVTTGGLGGGGQLTGNGSLYVEGGIYNGSIFGDLADFRFVDSVSFTGGSLSLPLIVLENGTFTFTDVTFDGEVQVLASATLFSPTDSYRDFTFTINGNLFNQGLFTYGSNPNYYEPFNVTVNGNVTNDGNMSSSRVRLIVSGDVFNNSTWLANLSLHGNLTNNGQCSGAVLHGPGVHIVDGSNPIGGLTIADAIELGSSTEIENDLTINGGTTLTINSPSLVTARGLKGGGQLIGSGSLHVGGGSYNGSIFGDLPEFRFVDSVSFASGSLSLPLIVLENGTFTFTDVTFNGEVQVLASATLFSPTDSYRDFMFTINGNLLNQGLFTNGSNPNYYEPFNVTVNGNVTNDGNMSSSRVRLTVSGDVFNNSNWNATLTIFGNLTNNGDWTSVVNAAWSEIPQSTGYELQLTTTLDSWPAPVPVAATTYSISELVDSIRFWRTRGIVEGEPTEWSEPRSINAGSVELLSPNIPATYEIGDPVLLEWTGSGLDPTDLMRLDMKRDSAAASLLEPDGIDWLRIVEATSNDGSEQVVIPAVYSQADDWRFYVRHAGTGVFDASDSVFVVECSDADGDGVCNELDACPGHDDLADADGDSVPDGCDDCQGDNATGDDDADGVCDDLDACPGFDDHADADGDSVPDGCDLCVGDNATGDPDGNGICEDVQGELPGPSLVWFDGRRLMWQKRNPDGTLEPAAPYVIRGVNWSPASESTTGDNAARRAEFGIWAATDAPLMAAMGVNTVRLYLDPGFDATALAVLDGLYNQGIMAILTVDDAVNDVARAQQAVAFFKDHPAVLMWMLGSEWNINLYFGNAACATPQQAALCTEAAAQAVKAIDTDHPVATSYGDIDIDTDGLRLADTAGYVEVDAPSVDVWSLNIFRGSNFGDLFDQWGSITGKPMFLGEFGTDAMYNAKTLIDETMQAHWDLCLWNDLLGELAEGHPQLPGIGGLVFEWNDEWWKVDPAGSQELGGFPGGHADGFANEEYFGLATIDRGLRLAAAVLSSAFDPGYALPPHGLALGTVSRGSAAAQFPGQFGVARFYRCGTELYERLGGGGGGRGFNVLSVDPATGDEISPPQNFDTYGTRSQCAANDPSAAMYALVDHLDAVPDGTLVMISVADEAGLNQDDSCAAFSDSTCYQEALAALEALGSTRIRDYCFRDSWAQIAVKGEGRAVAEGLATGDLVSLVSTLPDPGTFTLSVVKAGDGTGTVTSDPAGIDCDGSCLSAASSFATGTSVALDAIPSLDSLFTGWSGDEDCANGIVTVDADKSCTANFCLDADGDGICDDVDVCFGANETGDTDGDGVCDDIDQCQGDDASGDTDGDGVCDDIDQCQGNDASGDPDQDGICSDQDICFGDNSFGDGDDDGYCADVDCDDSDPTNTSAPCVLFQDGFESGDTLAWSSTVP